MTPLSIRHTSSGAPTSRVRGVVVASLAGGLALAATSAALVQPAAPARTPARVASAEAAVRVPTPGTAATLFGPTVYVQASDSPFAGTTFA